MELAFCWRCGSCATDVKDEPPWRVVTCRNCGCVAHYPLEGEPIMGKKKEQIVTGPNDDAVTVMGKVNAVLVANHGLIFTPEDPGDSEATTWNLTIIETKHEGRDS